MKFYSKKLLSILILAASINPLIFTSAQAGFEEHPENYSIAVLGGGIGGLTSALYLARAGLSPIVIEGPSPGGAIIQSTNVQNWPGELEISGLELAEKLRHQAELSGAAFLSEEVIDVDFSKRPFVITTRSLHDKQNIRKIQVQSSIIALGSNPKFLGIPGESGTGGYWTKGVYNCAVCDGALFKNKTVAVIGGGDSAITEAHYLSNIAKKVIVVVRKDTFRTVEQQRKNDILSKPNIEVLYNTSVTEILGNGEKVTHLVLKHLKDNTSYQRDVDGVFLAIGYTPNTSLFKDKLDLDNAGYVLLKHDQETSIPGVYAVGDIADPYYKQAISAAGEGAVAALQAERHLSANFPELAHNKNPHPSIEKAAPAAPSTLTVSHHPVKLNKASGAIEITSSEQFKKEIQEDSLPIVVDFYATWCGPCKQLAPMFEKWASQYSGKIKFLKVNVDKVVDLSEKYRISAMPTVLILDTKGNVIDRKIGTQQIRELDPQLDQLPQKGNW